MSNFALSVWVVAWKMHPITEIPHSNLCMACDGQTKGHYTRSIPYLYIYSCCEGSQHVEDL